MPWEESMNSYNVISEYEWGIWHGVAVGLVVGVVLTLWITGVL